MSRITRTLQNLKKNGKKGLIVYITGGYPDMNTTFQAVQAAAKAGADVVEIGIPFSDPMADGPVIQKAASAALEAGASVETIITTVKYLRQYTEVPLALMTYFNPVLQAGMENFIRSSLLAGVDGLIVPDLPLEENAVLAEPCEQEGMDLISFIAPTTTAERLEPLCCQGSGFIYCISNTGVTGAKEVDYSALEPLIGAARKYTDLPIAIGFGVSSPAAAAEAVRCADAVIVGSAVMQKLMDEGVEGMETFIAELRAAIDRAQ
ncbi:MAG TPA: tryptophan synthase subunit alpha [Patescibacteria group bacterium]|nr:tryptophan synthase subunit alpha [Patescibacteria group bacterium]